MLLHFIFKAAYDFVVYTVMHIFIKHGELISFSFVPLKLQHAMLGFILIVKN